MTFTQDFWERNLRAFYTSFISLGGTATLGHLSGTTDGLAGGNWHALKSLAVVTAGALAITIFTILKGLVAKGTGADPDSASAKGTFTNGA